MKTEEIKSIIESAVHNPGAKWAAVENHIEQLSAQRVADATAPLFVERDELKRNLDEVTKQNSDLSKKLESAYDIQSSFPTEREAAVAEAVASHIANADKLRAELSSAQQSYKLVANELSAHKQLIDKAHAEVSPEVAAHPAIKALFTPLVEHKRAHLEAQISALQAQREKL